MNIIQLHNYFRAETKLSLLQEHAVLDDYCEKTAKWMARRKWSVYWNFDKARNDLLKIDYNDVDYNIAVGDSEDVIIKHFLNNKEKKNKIYNPNFRYIGWGSFETDYRYWCLLYAY